ncbi:endonuclease domain-containing protein [Microlunatus sp. GCM10028923]|uniref:endonuclease domain-containing protein n=1 Tax=Microlunatus sp. GCM10028923 TaxID=3273400 RepID=UPI00360BFDF2
MNPIEDSADGLLAPRTPALQRRLRRLTERGEVVRLFPGVYCHPALEADVPTRIRGAALWSGAGVLLGAAAARLTFWPELEVRTIALALGSKRRQPRGLRISEQRLPTELIMEHRGVRLTVPSLTALDLGGPGIDRALLRRAANLDEMREALARCPGRAGNRARRLLLDDSRDEPWSEAERLLHRQLRGAKITGWRTNVEVWCGPQQYFIDAAFARLLIGIEVDGYAVHGQRGQFERDRQKWSDLTAAGWTLLHFTWRQLDERPDWVIATIQQTLRRKSR